MLSKFARDLLGQIKLDTARRNSQKSDKWLRNKLAKSADKKVKKPYPGRMYLFVYNAKYKDTLPYWDVNPMIILVAPAKGGFYGLNFHYLNMKDRLELLEMLVPFQKLVSAKTQRSIKMSYTKLLGLSKTKWKYCFKHYLVSHLSSHLIEIPMEEWYTTITLPIAHFKGSTPQEVWKVAK
jgi:hypothetical protein